MSHYLKHYRSFGPMKNRIIIFFAAILVFASCVREEPDMTPTTDMTEIIAKSQPTKVVTDGAINVLWENNTSANCMVFAIF